MHQAWLAKINSESSSEKTRWCYRDTSNNKQQWYVQTAIAADRLRNEGVSTRTQFTLKVQNIIRYRIIFFCNDRVNRYKSGLTGNSLSSGAKLYFNSWNSHSARHDRWTRHSRANSASKHISLARSLSRLIFRGDHEVNTPIMVHECWRANTMTTSMCEGLGN